MSVTDTSCQCGCGAMTTVTQATEPCTCGCECCNPPAEAHTKDGEVAELNRLREGIDRRLAELGER